MTAGELIKKYKIGKLYHFTGQDNIESIKKHGLLARCDHGKNGIVASYVSNDKSRDIDTRYGLDKYISLCFRCNHPMEYQKTKENKNIIWIEVSPDILAEPNVQICDGIANSIKTKRYSFVECFEHLDVEVLFARTDWKNPEINKRLKKTDKYEILVPKEVPLKFIKKYGTKTGIHSR